MLSPEEIEIFNFYQAQGRKYGVSISVISDVKAEELIKAQSEHQADEILLRGNRIISVKVSGE